MKLIAIAIFLLIGLSTQQCTTGCLKCTTADVCQLCDTTKMYYLSESTCALSTLTNCAVLNQGGACVRCNSGFYFESNSNSCVAVVTGSVVANCLNYSASQSCSSCAASFFLDGGACNAVTTAIGNCSFYSADGVCSACNTGYILGHTLTNCVEIPSSLNCLEYNFLTCQTCKTGFFINRNLYLLNHFTVSNVVSNHLSALTTTSSGLWMAQNTCQSVTIQNCTTLSAFNMCSVCNSGFFLSSGICVAFPKSSIFACKTYSTQEICTECTENYHLNSSGSCDHNTIIENCLTYSGTTTTTTCTGCTAEYYLSNTTTCTKRSNSLTINQCATKNVSEDECAKCVTDYKLTSDGRSCMPVINQCKAYATSAITHARLNCSVCNDGYYVTVANTVTTCTKGTIEFCKTYAASANTCTICQDGYYLSGNTCAKHIDITNCETYSQSEVNSCSICSAGYYSFTFSRVCVPTNVISNCMTYSADGLRCEKCNANYYVNGSTCTTIVAPYTNCVTFTNGQCQVCASGYMVNTLPQLGTCVAPLDYITRSVNDPCGTLATLASTVTATWTGISTAAAAPITCESCTSFSYGFTPTVNEPICVLTSQLVLNEGWTAITNCVRYGISLSNAEVLVCQECATNHFITGYRLNAYKSQPFSTANPDGIQCTSTCNTAATGDNAASTVLVDDLMGTVNICVINANKAHLNLADGCIRAAVSDLTGVITADAAFEANQIGCFVPAAGTTAAPFYLTVTGLALFANFDYSDNPGFPTFDVGMHTAKDASNTYPSVFNYIGLLNPQVVALNEAAEPDYFNPLTNCNLVYTIDATVAANQIYGSFLTATAGAPFASSNFIDALGTAIPVAGTIKTCLRCIPGYAPGYVATTGTATNARLPFCQTIQNCSNNSVVYGGLPTYLNGFFSCHQCNSNLFPSIYIETGASGTAGDTWRGRFLQWSVHGSYASATTITDFGGFKCHAAPSTYYNANSLVLGTVTGCGAFGYFQPITTAAVNVAAAGLVPASITPATYITENNYYTQGEAKFAPACIACAANYYPSDYMATAANAEAQIGSASFLPSWVITGCTQSTNCDTSVTTSFNSCTRCKASSGTTYYAFKNHMVGDCYQAASENCFILNDAANAAAANNVCDVCKAGYYKNSNNICETITIPNQGSGAKFYHSYFTSVIIVGGRDVNAAAFANKQKGIYIQNLLNFGLTTAYGISSCNSGYTKAASNKWASRVCVVSSFLTANTASIPANTEFVNNCLRYNLAANGDTPQNRCAQCNSGNIPTSDGSSCVAAITNCLLADIGTTTNCHTCNSSYLSAGGSCVQGNISNCMTYTNTVFAATSPNNPPLCSACNSEYYLSADATQCLIGSILNCDTYDQNLPNGCTACKANFVLISIPSSSKYCYPIDSNLHCSTYLSSSAAASFTKAQLSCETCTSTATAAFGVQDFFTINRDSQARTTCLAFNQISNCRTYNQSEANIELNDFHCAECIDGYYYNSSSRICVQRRNKPTRCTKYNLLADVCTVCSTGSFLSASGQECVLFPDGIFQCSQYTSATVCTQCKAHYFLTNNTCIISSTTVQNCNTYSADSTCTQCNSGFFLESPTSCINPNANNCLTVANTDACATCAAGRGLETLNGVTNCVNNSVLNCATPTTVAPFTCTTCNAGFWRNLSGVCTAVSTTITDCLEYDTATTCARCASNGVLNVAKTSCESTSYISHIDANCNENVLTSSPTCSQCPLGSYFVDGTCTDCSANTLASGCWSCDPTNASVCLVCATNYHMNSAGACIRSGQIPTPTGPTQPTTPAPASASLLKATVFFFAMLFIGRF